MSGKYPSDWGNLDDFEFEEWWKHDDYGFELFCEPEEREPLEVVKIIEDDKHIKHLRIDLTGDPKKLELMFKNFLKKNQQKPDLNSYARYQPLRHQTYLKLKAYARYRRTYVMREIEGKSRGDVIEDRMPPKAPHMTTKVREEQIISYRADPELQRSISREVQKAKLIIKNVEKGRFPF
ncbi:hypothetical protein [Candidatus Enterovibrio escicola]|nr:hypothetical protein [Candidatus Enterovibrio escacola]